MLQIGDRRMLIVKVEKQKSPGLHLGFFAV
jgi:hypothetical protein